MADQNIYDMSDTWNTGGTTFNFLKANITDSASASASNLFNFQVGGNVKGRLQKDGSLFLTSNDAGATVGPSVTLHRDSASPADDDILGEVKFDGEDDGGNQTTYARIYAQAKDVTDTTEDGSLFGQIMIAGTLTTVWTASATGLAINSGGLILPEVTAPSTAANQVAIYAKEHNGVATPFIRLESDGAEVPLNAWELIEATVLSSQANYARTGLSAYRLLKISGWAAPATDAQTLIMRTSTDNGSSYDSGASDYDWQTSFGFSSTWSGSRATGANFNISGFDIGNDTGEMVHFEILVTAFNQAAYAYLSARITGASNSGAINGGTVHGRRLQATARDAFRLSFGSGNIASGYVTVEGFRG